MTSIGRTDSLGPAMPEMDPDALATRDAAPTIDSRTATPPAGTFADQLVAGGPTAPTAESLLGAEPPASALPDAAGAPGTGRGEEGLAEFQSLLTESLSLEKEALDAEVAVARLVGGKAPTLMSAPTMRQSEELIEKMHTQAESFLSKAFALADDLVRRAEGDAAFLESAGLAQAEEILQGLDGQIEQLRSQAEAEATGKEGDDATAFWSQLDLRIADLRTEVQSRAEDTRTTARLGALKIRDDAFGQAYQIRQSAIDRADALHRTAFRQSHAVRSSRLESEENRADQTQDRKLAERAETLRQAELDVTRRLDGLRQALAAEFRNRQAQV